MNNLGNIRTKAWQSINRLIEKSKNARRAFTLIEVNLAVLVMAGGILSVVVLYSLGFRETRQSREDIGSAAYADAVMSPLVAALSATNVTWQAFNSLDECYPPKSGDKRGWGVYLNDGDGTVVSSPESMAQSAFSGVMSKLGASGVPSGYPNDADGGLKAGLVVFHEKDSAVVKIGFRAAKRASSLLSAPLYYTEVRFQGVQD